MRVAHQQQLAGLCLSPDGEIFPAPHVGIEECLGGVPTQPRFLVHFKVAHAFVIARVEVIAPGNTSLLRRLGKRI